MYQDDILSKIENNEKIDQIKSLIKTKFDFYISGCTDILKILLTNILLKNKKILFICSTQQQAIKYQTDFEKIFDKKAFVFYNQEVSLYETVPKNLYIFQQQFSIMSSRPDLIFIPVKALFEKFADPVFYEKNKIFYEKNKNYDLKEITQKLISFGYKRVTIVNDIGEFSIRGDILDIFSLDRHPVRIEFWGDSVVDIRFFDQKNQKSIEKIESIEVFPVYNFLMSKDIEENEKYFEYSDSLSYFTSYFNKDIKSIIEVLGNEYSIIFDESVEIFAKYENIERNLVSQYERNIEFAPELKLDVLNHVSLEEFKLQIEKCQKIYFDNFLDVNKDDILIEFENELLVSLSSNEIEIAKFVDNNLRHKNSVIIATDYVERVKEILKEFEIDISKVSFCPNISSKAAFIKDFSLAIMTDAQMFNKKVKDVTSRNFSYYKENQEFIESINDILNGDYVVHRVHGIGLYLGLTKQEIDGQIKDYLTIEYSNRDKLHIPADQINLLTRYIGGSSSQINGPKLSKMGGFDWKQVKTKAKKATEDIAKDLLRLYAKRQVTEGISFGEDTVWQYEMEESFEYTETKDQMKAILDVKKDMEMQKPMDRLICADVGFGKTEVAIRAMFKAAMFFKQSALVCPTTLLSLQHFNTIKERFKPFPIKIELLSRMKSRREQIEILKKIMLGEIDIVVGTHRLLQSDVVFKDLGLLVIDEEHKFGVKHKERLKEMRQNIDVLSMSATPIPRTLYMSLSGIKDMSIINTAPMNRLPIKTFVVEQSDAVIIKALNLELQREGQAFILYNRVCSIYDFANYVAKLVPNARIGVGHGKMSQRDLEDLMLKFEEKEYDILISTTIIESGLDIANANTMIIIDANCFGLAQLYQLRGRVGRSDRQAYCYCLYRDVHSLTHEAIERLKTIRDFTTLGSGYQIALRDIEIRGVGNILGTKQHGQMVNVGFETYCELLKQTVDEMRGNKENRIEPTIVDINVTAYIDENWVGSNEQKMIEYKRLSEVKSLNELELIESEWCDRFGKCPQEVQNLIKLVKLRLLGTQLNISLIRQTTDNIRLYTRFTEREYELIKMKLSKENGIIRRRLRWTRASKNVENTVSIILFNIDNLTFEQTFTMLTNLFYEIISHREEFGV